MGSPLHQALPSEVFARITQWRVTDPDRSLRAAAARKRRATFTDRHGSDDGRVMILAADHPARGSTEIGGDPLKMANRRDLLARLMCLLAAEAADGVLATLDVIEDLLVLHEWLGRSGGPRFLDEKLLIASLNRGGLQGSVWELDDPWTGPDADTCARWNLDGAKLLLRVAQDDPGSLRTLEMCAEAVRAFQSLGCPLFLEPLPMVRGDSGFVLQREATALAQLVGVASALGNSSRNLWLKLPACPDFATVAAATTLPIVILGGAVSDNQRSFLQEIATALAAGSNVRGLMIGRNALYPRGDDPFGLAIAIGGLVHHGWDVDRAAQAASGQTTDRASGTGWQWQFDVC